MQRGVMTRGRYARLPQGAEAIEIKASAAQAAAVMAGFMAFLPEVGAGHDPRQQARTRWAPDYCAARLRKQPAR